MLKAQTPSLLLDASFKVPSIQKLNSEDSFKNDEPHYSKYVGSYAQDEMGYSDEDIDTVFDGDPDAYWNID